VNNETIDALYSGMKLCSVIILFVWGVYKFKFDKFIFLYGTYILLYILSANMNNTMSLSLYVAILPGLVLILLLKIVIRHNDQIIFLKYLSNFFMLLVISNLLFLIIYPDGIWQEVTRQVNLYYELTPVHLLGKSNAVTPLLLIMSSFILIKDKLVNNKITAYGIIGLFIVLLSVILTKSSTGILGSLVYLFVILIFSLKLQSKLNKAINFRLYFIIGLIITLAVVFFQFQNNFSYIFELLFDKDITFSNRTNVWNLTFQYIRENFVLKNYLLGSGLSGYSAIIYAGRYAHAHNHLLHIFVQSGVFGVCIYIYLIYSALKSISNGQKQEPNVIYIILAANIFATVLMFITETYTTPMIVLLLYFSYRIDCFTNYKGVSSKKKGDV